MRLAIAMDLAEEVLGACGLISITISAVASLRDAVKNAGCMCLAVMGSPRGGGAEK